MIATTNEIVKLLKSKWDIIIPDDILVVIDLHYSIKLAPGRTQLYNVKRNKDVITITLLTSFGVFHQKHLEYNDIIVVLLETVSGSLAELRHDLIISELSYPPNPDKRSISCGQ